MFAKQYPSISLPEAGPNGSVIAHWGRSRAKQLVYAPSTFKPSLKEGSKLKHFLQRDWVHGINSQVEICTYDQGVIYAVGQLVVIYNERSSTQSYFEGHNADVSCIAWNRTRNICASGQQDPKGIGGPYICIWSPKYVDSGPFVECRYYIDREENENLEIADNIKVAKNYVCFPEKVLRGPVRNYNLPRKQFPMTVDADSKQIEAPLRSIQAVAFSRDGRKLIAIGNDDMNSVLLWDFPSIQSFNAQKKPTETLVFRKPSCVIQSGRDPMQDLILHDRSWELTSELILEANGTKGGELTSERLSATQNGGNGRDSGNKNGRHAGVNNAHYKTNIMPMQRSSAMQRESDKIVSMNGGEAKEPLKFVAWGKSEKGGYFKCWEFKLRTKNNQNGEFSGSMGVWGKFPRPKEITSVAYDLSDASGGCFLISASNGYLYTAQGNTVLGAYRVSDNYLGFVTYWKNSKFLVGGESGKVLIVRCVKGGKCMVEETVTLSQIEGDALMFQKVKEIKFNRGKLNQMTSNMYLTTANNTLIRYLHTEDKGERYSRVLTVSHSTNYCNALAVHPTVSGMFVTGGGDKQIQFWSGVERKPLIGKTLKMDSPVYSLAFDSGGDLMAVGMGDGLVAVYRFPDFLFQRRIAEDKVEGKLCGRICAVRFSCALQPPKGTTSGMNLSSHHPALADHGINTRYLACACWDNKIYILKIKGELVDQDLKTGQPKFDARVSMHKILTGNACTATHIQFTADAKYLVSNSRDGQIMVFRVSDGERQKGLSSFKDTPMDRPWTNILAWQTIGIWQLQYDLSMIGCCCSYQDEHLVHGDDLGTLKLYKFPVSYLNPPHKEYYGHGSGISNVMFFDVLPLMLSSGFNDQMICQWRITEPSKAVFEFKKIKYPWISYATANGAYGDVLDNMLGRYVGGAYDDGNDDDMKKNFAKNIQPFEGDGKLFYPDFEVVGHGNRDENYDRDGNYRDRDYNDTGGTNFDPYDRIQNPQDYQEYRDRYKNQYHNPYNSGYAYPGAYDDGHGGQGQYDRQGEYDRQRGYGYPQGQQQDRNRDRDNRDRNDDRRDDRKDDRKDRKGRSQSPDKDKKRARSPQRGGRGDKSRENKENNKSPNKQQRNSMQVTQEGTRMQQGNNMQNSMKTRNSGKAVNQFLQDSERPQRGNPVLFYHEQGSSVASTPKNDQNFEPPRRKNVGFPGGNGGFDGKRKDPSYPMRGSRHGNRDRRDIVIDDPGRRDDPGREFRDPGRGGRYDGRQGGCDDGRFNGPGNRNDRGFGGPSNNFNQTGPLNSNALKNLNATSGNLNATMGAPPMGGIRNGSATSTNGKWSQATPASQRCKNLAMKKFM